MVLMKVVGVGNRQARFSIFITDTFTIILITIIIIFVIIIMTVNFTIMSSSWTRSPQPSPSLQVERVQCNLMIISRWNNNLKYRNRFNDMENMQRFVNIYNKIKKIINNKNKKGGQCGTKLARQLSVSSDSRWIFLLKGNYEALFNFFTNSSLFRAFL